MRHLASATLTAFAATPVYAQSYDCTLNHLCIAQECSDPALSMPLVIDGDSAVLGPPDDALRLRATPLDAAGRRAFVAEDGRDVFFATLGEKLDFVMTSHLLNSAYRYAVTTGQCQEVR